MKHIFISFLLSILFLQPLSGWGSGSVILLDDVEKVTVNPDGTSITSDECSYKILNYDGLQSMRNMKMHFNSDYGTLAVTSLAVTKSDGSKYEFDPAHYTSVSVENSQMNSEIFDPAMKILSVNVPGLETGDTLHIGTLEKITKPRIPGQWSDIAVLQADFDIKKYTYIVDMPENMPLDSICVKDEVKGSLKFSKEKKNGRIIYTWHAANVPKQIPEPYSPPLYTCSQRILTSTVRSWEDISRWYHDLCVPHLDKINDAMKKKTAELISGKKSDDEKIMSLFQFVSQQIRYTGITDEDHAPGYEPHDVDKTFDRRHGVCRDKAALLTAMLKIAGFKAYPVLFMSGTPKDREVPNIYFNHAITAVEKSPGKYILMDPTFETTGELFPAYLAGDSYLVARADGDTLRTTAAAAAESNMLQIVTSAQLDGEKMLVTSVLDFSGIYDQMYRDAFSNWTSEDTVNYLSASVRRIVPGAKLLDYHIEPQNIRDMDKPLKLTLKYEASGVMTDRYVPQLFNMPRSSMIFGMLTSVYRASALKSRRLPLEMLPRAVKEKITLDFSKAPESKFVMPEKLDSRAKGIFRVKYDPEMKKSSLTENFFFAIDSMLVSPPDYGKFKGAAAKAEKMWRTLPVVCKERLNGNEANTEIIKSSVHYSISDGGNDWVRTMHVVKKIRNYAGLKESSNLTVPFIEGIEKIDVSAVVTDSKGKKHTLSPKEINYMDSPVTAGAPRYRKRKLAVVSFPGVDVGSVIDYKITAAAAERMFFYTEFTVQDDIPAAVRELIIEHPAKLPLKISPVPAEMEDSSTMGGKRIIRRYVVKNAPAIPEEPMQMTYSSFVPTLRISSGDNGFLEKHISDIAAAKSAETSENVVKLAEKIAAAVKKDAGKDDADIKIIYALEKYIYKHIRKIPLPLNDMLAGEFSLPQTTLKDGYGSSADRAILLGAMLKALDIRFFFIPVSSRAYHSEEELQMLNMYPEHIYTDLLVAAECKGADDVIILNSSGLYGNPGILHHEGGIMLESGEAEALFYNDSPDGTNLKCHIELAGDLSAKIRFEYTWNGNERERITEMFARFTPELARQYIEKLASSVAVDAEVESFKFIEKSCSGAEKLLLNLKVKDFARKSGGFISLTLPGYQILQNCVAMPAKIPRQTPFSFGRTETVELKYTISVPEKFRLVRSRSCEYVTASALDFGREYEFVSGLHCLNFSVRKDFQPVEPEEFKQMLNVHRIINHTENSNMIFTMEQNR